MSEPHHHLCLALDAISDPIFLLNENCECVWANEAFIEFLGMVPSRDRSLITESFWPNAPKFDALDGEFAVTFALVDPQAETQEVVLSVSRLKGEFSLCRIVSNPSQARQFHAQRLQTLGMLAGGIAHDFNNVLAGILGHITYLKTILPDAGPHVESLNAIEEGGRKASLLTQQILNFSKLDTTEDESPVNLGEIVVKTCHLLRGAISPEYNLSYEVPDQSIMVSAAEGKLAQVLVNLVMNSRDALSSGGSIRVTIEPHCEVKQLPAQVRARAADSNWSALRVVDDGSGMSPDVLKRIFEPYFSTKKDKGTGLGLSTVVAIVDACGGVIDISSEELKGTSVSVYLRESGEVVTTSGASGRLEKDELVGGSERILVVDDEDPVRNVLCVSLVHLGYTVEIASSGREALEVMENAENKFDLVILDMLMPHLSGDEVFFRMKELDEAVRVLVISGYSSEEAVQRILENGGLGFIQKPFTIEELSKKVRECLDGTRTRV